MKYVGRNLVTLSRSEPEKAHTIAASIMSGASERDESFENAMLELASVTGKHQRSMAAHLVKYRALPRSAEEEELPDNYDLMDQDSALDVLVDMSRDYNGEYEDINSATDSIMAMNPDERSRLGQRLLGANTNAAAAPHFFPLGVEIM